MAAKSTGWADKADEFERVFAALRGILLPYESSLNVTRNRPGDFCLETRGPGPRKVPLMFAAVKTNKRYVSFHLMPIYVSATKMSWPLERQCRARRAST